MKNLHSYFWIQIQHMPVTQIHFALNDKNLFVSLGSFVVIIRLMNSVASVSAVV